MKSVPSSLPILALSLVSHFTILPATQEQASITSIKRLGFYDEQHVSQDGKYYSVFSGSITNGNSRGYSSRYNGGTSGLGQSAWVANSDGVTQKVGFYDTVHTNHTGSKYSSTSSITGTGYYMGYSNRYLGGSADMGRTAWVGHLNEGSHQIGLVDDAHTLTSGYQYNVADIMNDAGVVAGTAYRASNNRSAKLGQSAWVANATGLTKMVGFYDAEHTKSDGMKQSTNQNMTASGHVVGYSARFNGGTSTLGNTYWITSVEGDTHKIGYYDAAHTSSTGLISNTASRVLNSGYVLGYTSRYDGNLSAKGQTTWIANTSGVTQRIGLYDALHTSSTKVQDNEQTYNNESGYSAGYAFIYNGGIANLGTSAWVADASGASQRIGLYDSAHTSSSGQQYSMVLGLAESGGLHGISRRYGSTGTLGQTAWIGTVSGSAVQKIGFYDEAHTNSSGSQTSEVKGFTNNGYYMGQSTRYNGGISALDSTLWVAKSNGVTNQIGLYDAEHTKLNGARTNTLTKLLDSGHVIGNTTRHIGTNNNYGTTFWVANSEGVTTRLGLTGDDYLRNDGYRKSDYSSATQSGFIAGYTYLYKQAATEYVRHAWGAKVTGETIQMGLSDAMHTRSDGYSTTTVNGLSEAGVAWGLSTRYNGTAGPLGSTAWLMNLNTQEQVRFDLSARASDQLSSSSIAGVTSDGVAYGYFNLYLVNESLGERAFLWNEKFGTVVLDEATTEGVNLYGWDFLSRISHVDTTDGYLFGLGRPLGSAISSQGAYLAYMSIPEPSKACLLLLGGFVLMMRRRR